MDRDHDDVDLIEEDRASRAAAARRRLRIRTIIALGVLAASVFLVRANFAKVMYYVGPRQAQDVGDVRAKPAEGGTGIDAKPGAYVKASNLLVTNPREGNFGTYFYCPVSRILVRTQRPLPQSTDRVIEADVPVWLEYLLNERRAMPEDFATRMDVEGRLVRLRDLPGFDGAVGEYIRGPLRLTDADIDRSFGLLDGDVPSAHLASLLIVLASLVVSLLSLSSLVLAWRAVRRGHPK